MQNINDDFDIAARYTERQQIKKLEPVRDMLSEFFKAFEIPSSVFFVTRKEKSPVLIITPNNEAHISRLAETLKQKRIISDDFRGIGLAEIMCVLEKEGNKHWGVVLNAGPSLIACVADTLCGKKSNPQAGEKYEPATV